MAKMMIVMERSMRIWKEPPSAGTVQQISLGAVVEERRFAKEVLGGAVNLNMTPTLKIAMAKMMTVMERSMRAKGKVA